MTMEHIQEMEQICEQLQPGRENINALLNNARHYQVPNKEEERKKYTPNSPQWLPSVLFKSEAAVEATMVSLKTAQPSEGQKESSFSSSTPLVDTSSDTMPLLGESIPPWLSYAERHNLPHVLKQELAVTFRRADLLRLSAHLMNNNNNNNSDNSGGVVRALTQEILQLEENILMKENLRRQLLMSLQPTTHIDDNSKHIDGLIVQMDEAEMAKLSNLDEDIETLKVSKLSKASNKQTAMEHLQLRWNYSYRRKLINTYYPKDIATAMGNSLRDIITTITAAPLNGTQQTQQTQQTPGKQGMEGMEGMEGTTFAANDGEQRRAAEHTEEGLRITLVHHHAADIPMMVDVLTTTTAALTATLSASKKHAKYRYTSLEQLSLAIRPYRGSPLSTTLFQGVVDLAIVCKLTVIHV